MLKITIITIGKLKESSMVDLEQEYIKRLRPFSLLKIIELAESPYRDEKDAKKARSQEARSIAKYLNPEQFVVALDEKGKLVDSEKFAHIIGPHASSGREIVFVIGSSTGLDEEIKKRANWVFSLSPLTFTHNFARIILEEQIYRAATILNEKIYHK